MSCRVNNEQMSFCSRIYKVLLTDIIVLICTTYDTVMTISLMLQIKKQRFKLRLAKLKSLSLVCDKAEIQTPIF